MPRDDELAQIELNKVQEPYRNPAYDDMEEQEPSLTSGSSSGLADWSDQIKKWDEAGNYELDERWTGTYNGPKDAGPAPDRWTPDEVAIWKGLQPDFDAPERFPKELPEGALDWDDNGNPTFGGRTEFQEWQLQAHHNMRNKPQVTAEEASWDDWAAPKISEQEGIKDKGKAVLAGVFEGFKQVGQSVDYMLAGGDDERNAIQNAWQEVTHAGAETLWRAGSIANQLKMGFGGVAHLVEEKFQIGSAVGDEDVFFTEEYEELAANSNEFTIADKQEQNFWRKIGVSDKVIDEYRQGALAGRMFYSTIWDNTVDRVKGISGTGQAGNIKKEEFMRIMKASPNKNPNVEVKRYENPAAEMWGEIIFDPLNVFEWGAKTAVAAVAVSKAASLMAKPMKATSKFLEAKKFSRVSGLVDDAAAVAEHAGLITARIADIRAIKAKDTKWAKSKNIFGLTNSAKAHVVSQDMTAVTQWAWRMSKGPDGVHNIDTFQEINRLIRKSAGNEEDIAEALQGLSKMPGYDIVFSEPGTRTAVMMDDMWSEGKLDLIRETLTKHDDYNDGLREAVELADSMITDQAKKFFPDIADEAYKAKGGWKTLANTHQYMQDKVYKNFNKFFSAIYLGLNPGFAARNVMQNTVQALMDEGIKGAFNFNSLQHITDWGADITPYAAITEFGTVAAGEAAEHTSRMFASNWAAKGEKFAGLRIFGKVYPKTMKQLLRKGLGWKELKTMGFNQEESRQLLAIIIDSKGDYNKAFDLMESMAKNGYADLGKSSLSWTDQMVKWADETGMYDDILDVMATSKNKDEAVDSIRELFQKGWDAGDGVVDDMPVIAVGSLGAEDVHASATEIEKFGGRLMKEDHLYHTTYHGMNERAFKLGHKTATDYNASLAGQMIGDGVFSNMDEANEYLLRALDGIQLDGTDKLLTDFLHVDAGLEYGRVSRQSTRKLGEYFAISDDLRKNKSPLKEIWERAGLDKTNGPYRDQTKNEVWQAAWFKAVAERRPLYETFRDEAALAIKQIGDIRLEAASLKAGKAYPEQNLKELQQMLAKSRKFDEFLDISQIRRPLNYAIKQKDTVGIAVQFARMFNINTASEFGAAADQKMLNIINSKLGLSYNELSDIQGKVTPEMIAKAFLAHATDETIGIYETAGREGFDALRRLVAEGVLDDDIPIITKTLGVVRQQDKGLADSITRLYKQIEYKKGVIKKQGKRKTATTLEEAQEELGELSGKLDDLIDDAEHQLQEVGALAKKDPLQPRKDFIEKFGQYPEPTKEGYRVVYHATSKENLGKIEAEGLLTEYATGKGDGPAGVLWATDSPTGYGDYDKPLVAFQVPESMVSDAGGQLRFTDDIPPEDILRTYPGQTVEGEIFREDFIFSRGEDTQKKFLDRLFPESVGAEDQSVRGVTEELIETDFNDIMETAFDADMTYFSGENVRSSAGQWYDRRPQIREFEEQFVKMAEENFGKQIPLEDKRRLMSALKSSRRKVGDRVEEARQISNKVAQNKRNFILHDYAKKRNFDLALSYVMPYHFWYNRTYAAWLQRTMTHPGTMTAYLDYKNALGKMHADMPDWWKNNLNTNELLGIDSENPFYFNLEQTLNPLNGLLGLDFDDRDKAFSAFASTMQDVGKFGPSVYTPIAWGLAFDAYRRGETEAMQKWAGRAIPQTQALKALTAKMGFGPGGSGIELDPAIWLTSGGIHGQGGIDVWETRRVGRALGWAVDEGILTQEQAQQAAMEGPGNPDFDNARGAAQDKRSDGQLGSFFFGTGFKARTKEDLEIDQMDSEYQRFLIQKPDMTKDAIVDAYRYFAEKYPFFNTLQIARRDVDGRDTAYAFNVLSRIPPGQSKEAYRAMGLSHEQVNEFWEASEIPEGWDERERVNFIAAIQDVGTMLAMPQDATRDEWDAVRSKNSAIYEQAEQMWGEETVDLVDVFWGLYGEDAEQAKALREKYPQIDEYNDFLTMAKANDPLLAKYYASFDSLRYLIRGETYDTLDEKYGKEFYAIYETYNELRLSDQKAAKAYKKANPIIGEYKEDKANLQQAAAQRLLKFADYLPDRTPEPVWRPDMPTAQAQTGPQQQIAQAFGQEEVPEHFRWSYGQWQSQLSPALGRLVEDVVSGLEPDLSYTAEQALEYQLRTLGEDTTTIMALIRQSAGGYTGQPAAPEPQSSTSPSTQDARTVVGNKMFIWYEDNSFAWYKIRPDSNGNLVKTSPPRGWNANGTQKPEK